MGIDGDPAPYPKRGRASPKFRPMSFVAKQLHGSRCHLVRDIELDGDPAPPPVKGHCPQFSAHVGCGQTAGWTKMPLDVQEGLGPGDFVLAGDPVIPT